MAENNWALNIGGAPASVDQEFSTPATPWAAFDWFSPLGYQMAAEGGAVPFNPWSQLGPMLAQ